LADLIRSGNAPEVVRRKGAIGSLPLPVEEKIEILTVLAGDPDAGVRAQAVETLRGWDPAEFRRIMASPQTAPEVLSFAAQHLLPEREELRDILLWNPSLPPESRTLVQQKPAPQPTDLEAANSPAARVSREFIPPLRLPDAPKVSPSNVATAAFPAAEEGTIEVLAKLAAGISIEELGGTGVETPPVVRKRDDELTQEDRETLIEKIGHMSVVEKVKAALTGNLESRSLLIRDSNKLVSRAVLQSPRLSETEIEGYAAAKNVSEDVLRLIAASRKWMKSYVVARALVNNPRAPIDVTLRLVVRLSDKDLKGISINRNVPDVIRSMAFKAIKQKDEAARVKRRGRF